MLSRKQLKQGLKNWKSSEKDEMEAVERMEFLIAALPESTKLTLEDEEKAEEVRVAFTAWR